MKGPITADKVTQEQIQQASNIIKKKHNAKQVILFGSKARGLSDKESDIDFCVIIEKPKKRKIEIAREVRKDLRHYISAPLDVLIYDEKSFNERAALGITMEATILKEGIVL
ncbi:hypothetical protein ES708_34737 [subsurface metagenome]